ncbi:TPA: sel1 repeat family protein [Morganella morganii]|nr:sel1 repeat family protein [Morganella morganii]HBL6964288.1 sel1 repeat family protein [Morganella morganii]
MMYKNGAAGVQDNVLAIKWFLKAAEQNHASAQFNLGMMYQNGDGVEKNEKVAQEWFQKAEQQKTK